MFSDSIAFNACSSPFPLLAFFVDIGYVVPLCAALPLRGRCVFLGEFVEVLDYCIVSSNIIFIMGCKNGLFL